MLNREKLAKDLAGIISKLFPDLGAQSDLAQKKWQEIACDQAFSQRIEAAHSSFLLPRWRGNLSDTFKIKQKNTNYTVVSVDGSQIYPDRHIAGAGCFLINVGGVTLSYGQNSCAQFFTEPKTLLPLDIVSDFDRISFSRDLVDLKREELELERSFEESQKYKDQNVTCLFDGTIVFWNLEAKQPEIKKLFLNKYLYYLDLFSKQKIPCGGYISMPKSRELVNLIRIGLCRFTAADCIGCHKEYDDFPCKLVDHMIDTNVVRSFLKPFHRTTIFYSTSKIIENYPDHLKPAFFYLDVGKEIVRLEVPRYVADDEDLLQQICAVSIDQSQKGMGYPVCIAEAHEQAVVKGPDRDFFYHLIQKVGIEKHKNVFMSQKSIKKRGLGV